MLTGLQHALKMEVGLGGSLTRFVNSACFFLSVASMRFLASMRSLAGTSLSRSGSYLTDEVSAELMLLVKVSFMTCVQHCRQSDIVSEPACPHPRAAPSGTMKAALQHESWVEVYVCLCNTAMQEAGIVMAAMIMPPAGLIHSN